MTGGRSLNTSDFKERQSEHSTTGNDRGLKKERLWREVAQRRLMKHKYDGASSQQRHRDISEHFRI